MKQSEDSADPYTVTILHNGRFFNITAKDGKLDMRVIENGGGGRAATDEEKVEITEKLLYFFSVVAVEVG